MTAGLNKIKIFIDGNNCSNQKDFWNAYARQIETDSALRFGKNLDAFNDAITGGGPGYPGKCSIEISGIDNLISIFGKSSFQYIIDLLKDAEYIELILVN